MRPTRFFCTALLFALIFAALSARNAAVGAALDSPSPVLEVKTGFEHESLQGYVDFLPDPAAQFSLAELISAPVDRFSPVADIGRSHGLVEGAYWLRFTLRQNGPEARDLFLEIAYPDLDAIELYAPAPDGTYGSKQTGDRLPFNLREVQYQNPGFRIKLADTAPKTFYLRIETRGAMAFPMTLWAPQPFVDATFSKRTVLGAFYGVILAIILYNLVRAVWLRDKPTFYYVLHIATLALLLSNADGLAFQYLWPGSPLLANWSQPVLMLLALLTATQFTRIFLDTAGRARWLDRAMLALMATTLSALAALPFVDYRQALALSALLTLVHLVCYLAAGFWLVPRKYLPARIFLAALAIEIIGGGLTAMRIAGIVPESFWIVHSLHIGAVSAMMLLSVGLAARISFLKRQRELVEPRSAGSLAPALTRESEQDIEALVQKRTLQLTEANNALRMQVEERMRTERMLREREQRMRYLAHHDALTGLANRILLDDRLQIAIARARRNSSLVAALLIDLDHFKQINDTLGHDIGDGLLTEVAERLRAATRAGDTVARLSGDEFVIILADLKSAADAAQVAEKIIDILTLPIIVAGKTVQTSPSIGISLFPTNGSDTKTLLKRADIAMYRAKRMGRNAFCFFGEQDFERTA
ncbi:MAG: diguanylate cyclase [Burkholderiales bacterium]|nr:diguanylate cyclase [Burkholderiales bacterium]